MDTEDGINVDREPRRDRIVDREDEGRVSWAGLVLAIASAIAAFFIGCPSIICGVIAIVLYILVSRSQGGKGDRRQVE